MVSDHPQLSGGSDCVTLRCKATKGALMQLAELAVEHLVLPLNSMKVELTRDRKQCKSRADLNKHTLLVFPDGRKFNVSTRFWGSFCSLTNLSPSIFDYFSYDEVFNRITTTKGNTVRISLEEKEGNPATGTVLSCTNPSKPLLRLPEVKELIADYSGERVDYSYGVVQASFDTPFPQEYNIAGNEFKTRFLMQMPIDGYGLPSAFLEMLRTVCSNGAVGIAKAFKTVFQLGKEDNDLAPVLDRAMTSFNNEEGYHSFKLRLESAAKSWASFHEAGALHELLNKIMTADGFDLPTKMGILKRYNEMTGNPLAFYGVTSGHELSTRKAKTIPVQATIYDLINFATEVATHHVRSQASRVRLNAWLGDKLTNEYDLEGTVDTNPEFKDFFLPSTPNLAAPGGDLNLEDIEEPDSEIIVVN